MYTQETDKFSEIVDVTLYKYNSIDIKIWGMVKRNSKHKRLSDNSVLIQAEALKTIVFGSFRQDINRINAVGDSGMAKEATSVYFLNQIFNSIVNLSWVKITLNNNASYNRLTEIDEIKTIKFSIKTIRGTVKLFDILHPSELITANGLLIKAGLLKPGEHFKIFKLKSLLQKLDLYISENNTSDVISLLNPIIVKLEAHESDDPEVLLITDYESDI